MKCSQFLQAVVMLLHVMSYMIPLWSGCLYLSSGKPCSDRICWCDQQSSILDLDCFVKKKTVTYNDAIYNDSNILNVFYDYNHETAWCSALKPKRITYKAKPYKTFSETIRAIIWEDSKKIKLICSKNEYKTINGTESPSPWGGMEKLPRSYNQLLQEQSRLRMEC